jgi:hypothetical protein
MFLFMRVRHQSENLEYSDLYMATTAQACLSTGVCGNVHEVHVGYLHMLPAIVVASA